jgi:hypothetical protein
MAKKPRDPMRFMREAQRIQRASPLLRYLGKVSPDEPPVADPPAAQSPPAPDQPAPSPRKGRSGRKQEFDRDALWRLADQHPDWSDKDLHHYLERNPDWSDKNLRCYPAKDDKQKVPSLRWVQRCMQDYRDRMRQK